MTPKRHRDPEPFGSMALGSPKTGSTLIAHANTVKRVSSPLHGSLEEYPSLRLVRLCYSSSFNVMARSTR